MKLIVDLPADVGVSQHVDGHYFLAVPVKTAAAFVEKLAEDIDELTSLVDEMGGTAPAVAATAKRAARGR